MTCSFIALALLMMPVYSSIAPMKIGRNAGTNYPQLLRSLQSSNVVSTSECDHIRIEPFVARLELEYLYLVETLAPLRNLKGLQNVNNQAILNALHSCDADGFPQYALDLSTPHERVEQGFCIPQNRDSFCSIVRGRTNIYLDTGVTDARDIAYTALEAALSDPKFVVLFEPNVTFSRFLRSVHESILLVAADEPTKGDNEAPSTPATLTVAIAISSVVFVVISISLYGIVRQQKRLNSSHQDAAAQREASRKSRRERRRYFRTMDSNDDSTSVPIAQLTTDHDGTSFPWSDITSDSASVVSILSRSPSIRLQKIDEEPDHERHAEVEAIWDLQAPLSSHYRVAYMAHKGRLQEIVRQACFDDPVEDNKTPQNTPTTEATFPTSFTDSDNIVVSDSSLQDPPSVEFKTPTARLTLSDFDTPPSGIPQEDNTKDNDTATNDAPSVTIVSIDQSPAWSDQAFDNNTDNDQGFAPRSDVSLNQSIDTNDSDASLQRWLARLLLELHLSQQTKRIEL